MKLSTTLLGTLLACLSLNAWASPVGLWQTVDEKGQKKAVVRITQDANGLSGRILQLIQKPGALCEACQGELHNKPIEGMQIIWGLQPKEDHTKQWSRGQILDPANGKTYKLNAELSKDGQTFKLRGYIGAPLLGRTQVWHKIGD